MKAERFTPEFELVAITPTIRACLKCDRDFSSIGKQNRLCERCKEAAGSDDGLVYPSGLAERERDAITYHYNYKKKGKRHG